MVKVWVNGSFDVLHVGHIRLLQYANLFGEVRVGIDSDRRIRHLKGESRPFNQGTDRIEFLKSIKYVNSVVTFDSDQELIDHIKEYKPNIMVIGDDYINKPIIGSEFIPEIRFFEKIKDKSTSQILNYGKTNSI